MLARRRSGRRGEVFRAFWSQVEKLVEIGVSPPDAEQIIDMVRPTSGTYKPADDVPSSEPLRP